MTPLEAVLLATGMALLGRHAVTSLLPATARSYRSKAESQAEALREEFVFLSPAALQGLALLSGCALFAAALPLSGPLLAVAPGVSASLLVPPLAVSALRQRRKKRILRQLPTLLRLVSSSVRSGNSFPQALHLSASLLPPEIRWEAEWFCRRSRLGAPPWEILREWEERMACEEFRLALRPLRMAVRCGGNVAELLDRSRSILEARRRGAERLDALTAQGRMQALVLSLMPPALLLLLFQVDPSLRGNLFGTPGGRLLLGVSALLQAAGWFLVRRLTRIAP